MAVRLVLSHICLSHRRCQQAVESDRRRLLRRRLSDWRVWCQVERHRKELLQQQEETRRKMAALINAAASGKLGAEKSPPVTNPPETLSPTENISHQVRTYTVRFFILIKLFHKPSSFHHRMWQQLQKSVHQLHKPLSRLAVQRPRPLRPGK